MNASAITIAIQARYRRSAHLKHDFADEAALQGYVLSSLGRSIAARALSSATSSEGQRALSVVGPYGTGKSSFLTFFARLAAPDSWKASRLQLEPDDELVELAAEVGGLVPVLVTGYRGSLCGALAHGLYEAAQVFWRGPGAKPAIFAQLQALTTRANNNEQVDAPEVVDAALGLAEAIRASSKQGSGLCVTIDELGKFLERVALDAEGDVADIYVLQLLAEAAQRTEQAPILLFTCLHQSLALYAQRLPRATQVEWAKISGRFETLPFLEPPRHLVRLISSALEQGPGAVTVVERAREEARVLIEGSNYLEPIDEDVLAGCAPLSPGCALCLGPLFRTQVGQNERSLFALLSSSEPFGLREFLEEQAAGSNRMYRLSDLYNYIQANTGVRLIMGGIDRTWSACAQALSRLPKSAEEVDVHVLKHIAILSLAGGPSGLRADKDMLAATLGETSARTEAALERLRKAGAVIYRDFKGSWAIWDGSDLDVASLLADRRRQVEARGGLAQELERLFKPPPIVASRHYLKTGTLRHLAVSYVGVQTSLTKFPEADHGDGDLLCVIPDSLEGLEQQREHLTEFSGKSASGRPQILALPKQSIQLRERVIDYFAIEEALRSTPELVSDPVAKRELQGRLLAARDRLSDALTRAFMSAPDKPQWFGTDGRQLEIDGISATASRLFDEVFTQAPTVRNELLNRRSVSSYAAAAINTLAGLMMSDASHARLNIKGYPAHLSMYRSLFEDTGLHAPLQSMEDEGLWGFVRPNSGRLVQVWAQLDRELVSGKRIYATQLLDVLCAPPIGLREPPAQLLLLAYVLSNTESIFAYQENSFVPELEAPEAERFLKRPGDYEFQRVGHLPEHALVVQRLSEEMGDVGNMSLLAIVRNVVRRIQRLSAWAQSTKSVSGSATRLRSAILGARDPVRLLFEELPRVLELSGPEAPEYAQELTHRLGELEGADAALLDRIGNSLAEHFGGTGTGDAFFERLRQRGERLETSGDLPTKLKRFASGLSEFDAQDEGSRQNSLFIIGTSLIGKPPPIWDDEDERRLAFVLHEMAREFEAYEQLLSERGEADPPKADELWRVSLKAPSGERWLRFEAPALEAKQERALTKMFTEWSEEHGIDPQTVALMMLRNRFGVIDADEEQI